MFKTERKGTQKTLQSRHPTLRMPTHRALRTETSTPRSAGPPTNAMHPTQPNVSKSYGACLAAPPSAPGAAATACTAAGSRLRGT